MNKFFTKNLRFALFLMLSMTAMKSINAQVAVGCWANWAGSGSGTAPGFTPTCSNQTLNVPSTGYTYWAPGAAGSRGGQYTFSAAGGAWGAGYYISIYYLNLAGSAWVPLTGGLNSVTFTMPLACENIANTAAAPYLVTVTNSANSSANWARDCSANNGTNWTGNSATLTCFIHYHI